MPCKPLAGSNLNFRAQKNYKNFHLNFSFNKSSPHAADINSSSRLPPFVSYRMPASGQVFQEVEGPPPISDISALLFPRFCDLCLQSGRELFGIRIELAGAGPLCVSGFSLILSPYFFTALGAMSVGLDISRVDIFSRNVQRLMTFIATTSNPPKLPSL